VNAYEVAAGTPDPELPLLTLADLGILREVEEREGGVVVSITPTYSGCPALREITADLTGRLRAAGYREVEIRTRLVPPWSSDWITESGRAKLARAGIAPPAPAARHAGPIPLAFGRPPAVACPRCGSPETTQTAAFGATACKSLHRCAACAEPFEAVKPI
jgi:ring-1,2-phenylacetyl-CoA epoxidase subunit PaaD